MRPINLLTQLQFHKNRLSALGHRAQVTLQSQGMTTLLRKLLMQRSKTLPLSPLPPSSQIGKLDGARVLVIDTALPQPDRDSGSVRALQLLQLIQRCGLHIDFLTERPHKDSVYLRALQDQGVRVLPSASINAFRCALQENTTYAAAIVCRYHLAEFWFPLLRRCLPNTRLILDTVDLHHLREQREAEIKKNRRLQHLANQTQRREMAVINASDVTWVVSPKEQQALQAKNCRPPVLLVPNLHTPSETQIKFEQRNGLLFIGGAGHPPNVDAVNWLLDEILPRVFAARQDIAVHLVGTQLSTVITKELPSNIYCHDYVPDLTNLLNQTRISIAPLRFGAGVKGKVSQSLAHGLPVVVTSCAAEGMHLQHEKNALIADDADAFATCILRLHEDRALWETLSQHGYRVIQEHFSPDALLSNIQASFNTAAAS